MLENAAISPLIQKIDDLNNKAWEIRVTDSEKVLSLTTEAIELSSQVNYKKGLAYGKALLGFYYIRLAKNEIALPLIQEAFALFKEIDEPKGLAIAYQYLGLINRNWGKFGESLNYLFKSLELSTNIGFDDHVTTGYYQIGVNYKLLGNIEKAVENLYQAKELSKKFDFPLYGAYAINVLGSIYFDTGEYEKALDCYLQGLETRHKLGDKWGEAGSLDNIGFTYLKLKDYAKAIDYCSNSLEITKAIGDNKGHANTLLHLAEIFEEKNDLELAEKYANESLELRKASGDKRGEAEARLFLAELLKPKLENQSIVADLLSQALKISEEIKSLDLISKTRFHLYVFHKQKDEFKEAIRELEEHMRLEKELHKNVINQKLQSLEISYKAEEARKESDAVKLKNEELVQLNKKIESQKQKLEQTITELQSTQAQLIQSEKMASLGELTAGIAHEIQNPLNFVNNFSEVNKELLAEMNEEISKGDLEAAQAIAKDVSANQEKINYHGKRADAIVKSMLQHSRISTGQKELTDINLLADEYLRLAYHGLRAKDKSFTADFKSDLDPELEKVNVIPQDIGRVLLNLINNAFYAVSAKKTSGKDDNYKPAVIVSTKRVPGKIEIVVHDNGNGIPPKIREKIFQPFFTTKPTGEGTGLGLSLSYDIITKGHSGDLKVETREGEGSEFIVQLPV